jgi:hypothetical protein
LTKRAIIDTMIARFYGGFVTFLAVIPVAGIAAQLLMFRWSLTRGNRRIALRVMHCMTFSSFFYCFLVHVLD